MLAPMVFNWIWFALTSLGQRSIFVSFLYFLIGLCLISTTLVFIVVSIDWDVDLAEDLVLIASNVGSCSGHLIDCVGVALRRECLRVVLTLAGRDRLTCYGWARQLMGIIRCVHNIANVWLLALSRDCTRVVSPTEWSRIWTVAWVRHINLRSYFVVSFWLALLTSTGWARYTSQRRCLIYICVKYLWVNCRCSSYTSPVLFQFK